MATEQDYGSWFFAMAELGLAPNWSFEVSTMYNTIRNDNPKKPEGKFFPTIGAVYTKDSNRFSLRYVKQVEGVVCSGGICRLEPAFSGIRFSLTSSF